MRAIVKIHELNSAEGKQIIERNLSRILDVRIVEIDVDRRTVSLIYDSILAFENAKNELKRIGFPIVKCIHRPPEKTRHLQHSTRA